MELVRPSFTIMNFPRDLSILESAGRTCYKSDSELTDESSRKFARMLLTRGHESVIEHLSITVRIVCDRGVTHEIVRHRLASYSQESTRYCNYKGGVSFIIPPWSAVEPGTYDHSPVGLKDGDLTWFNAMLQAEGAYMDLIEDGWKPQMARSVLPNSLKTEIVMTANLREWRHFFKLRTSLQAHPQMREIAIPMLDAYRGIVPVIFEDINAEA